MKQKEIYSRIVLTEKFSTNFIFEIEVTPILDRSYWYNTIVLGDEPVRFFAITPPDNSVFIVIETQSDSFGRSLLSKHCTIIRTIKSDVI